VKITHIFVLEKCWEIARNSKILHKFGQNPCCFPEIHENAKGTMLILPLPWKDSNFRRRNIYKLR